MYDKYTLNSTLSQMQKCTCDFLHSALPLGGGV